MPFPAKKMASAAAGKVIATYRTAFQEKAPDVESRCMPAQAAHDAAR
jgi:hypothetical protein